MFSPCEKKDNVENLLACVYRSRSRSPVGGDKRYRDNRSVSPQYRYTQGYNSNSIASLFTYIFICYFEVGCINCVNFWLSIVHHTGGPRPQEKGVEITVQGGHQTTTDFDSTFCFTLYFILH